MERVAPSCSLRNRNPTSMRASSDSGGDFTSPCSHTRSLFRIAYYMSYLAYFQAPAGFTRDLSVESVAAFTTPHGSTRSLPIRALDEQPHGAIGAGGGAFEAGYAQGFELGFGGEHVVDQQGEVVVFAVGIKRATPPRSVRLHRSTELQEALSRSRPRPYPGIL
jgi:hypothetical protein